MTSGRWWWAAVRCALIGPVTVLVLLIGGLTANHSPDLLPPAVSQPSPVDDAGPEVMRVRSRFVDASVSVPILLVFLSVALSWASPFLAARAWRLQGPGFRRRLIFPLYLLALLLLQLTPLGRS
jgi:hypothetical protein